MGEGVCYEGMRMYLESFTKGVGRNGSGGQKYIFIGSLSDLTTVAIYWEGS